MKNTLYGILVLVFICLNFACNKSQAPTTAVNNAGSIVRAKDSTSGVINSGDGLDEGIGAQSFNCYVPANSTDLANCFSGISACGGNWIELNYASCGNGSQTGAMSVQRCFQVINSTDASSGTFTINVGGFDPSIVVNSRTILNDSNTGAVGCLTIQIPNADIIVGMNSVIFTSGFSNGGECDIISYQITGPFQPVDCYATSTPTPTSTPTNTPTPTFTPTHTFTFTDTPSKTPSTFTPTSTPGTPTKTMTNTPTATFTIATSTPTQIFTPTQTPILTPTFTFTPTNTLTPIFTPTPTPNLCDGCTNTRDKQIVDLYFESVKGQKTTFAACVACGYAPITCPVCEALEATEIAGDAGAVMGIEVGYTECLSDNNCN